MINFDRINLYLRDRAQTRNPEILSATAPSALSSQGSQYFNPSNFAGFSPGRLGHRILFGGAGSAIAGATTDLSSYQYIKIGGCFRGQAQRYWDTLANGGIQVILFDINNNYQGWNIYGGDIIFDSLTGNTAEGFPAPFASARDATQPRWVIDLNYPPSVSSPTPIDLTQVVGIELHQNTVSTIPSAGSNFFSIGGFYAFNPETITGNESISSIAQAYDSGDSYYKLLQHFSGANLSFSGQSGQIVTLMYGLRFGNGSDATTIEESDKTFVYTSPINSNVGLNTNYYPYVVANDRRTVINQSANDIFRLTDCNEEAITDVAGGTITIEVIGSTSGTYEIIRGVSVGIKYILNHGRFEQRIFDRCYGIQIAGDCSFIQCTYRNAPEGNGLELTSGAGDYSAMEITFANNAGYDLTLGDGGAGVYNFSKISVANGYTLKIHNDSTNDITVVLPAGIDTQITSNGGEVEIQRPPNVGRVLSLLPNSRIQLFNLSTNTELVNSAEPSTSFNYEYSEGEQVSDGDLIRVRVGKNQGNSGFITFENTVTTSSTGFTIEAVYSDDKVYNANGFDGETLAGEFMADIPNVDIIGDVETTSVARLYNWLQWYQTTADGIRNWVGAITALDVANYIINTSMMDFRLDNLNSNQVFFEGNIFLSRDDGRSPVVANTTGAGITLNSGKVFTTNLNDIPTKEAIRQEIDDNGKRGLSEFQQKLLLNSQQINRDESTLDTLDNDNLTVIAKSPLFDRDGNPTGDKSKIEFVGRAVEV